MKIESAVLVPQLMKVDVSMRNFSLSHESRGVIIPKGKEREKTDFGGCLANVEVEKKQTNKQQLTG